MDSVWSTAVVTLLHILVFVYWLGGDLGAFYASRILTDAHQPAPARMAAARVLANVDMAPRTALILAAPTGLTLAVSKAWLAWPWEILALIWTIGLVWLALAWALHLTHAPPRSIWRQIDLAMRWGAIAALAALAANLMGAAPLFIQIKAGVLAIAIFLGLAIRAALAPFGPAFGALAQGKADDSVNSTISASLSRARPLVICIWLCLLLAAMVGIAKPL